MLTVTLNDLMAAVSKSGSRACNRRRIIASDGRRSGSMRSASAVVAGMGPGMQFGPALTGEP